jgi:hypothetical protein
MTVPSSRVPTGRSTACSRSPSARRRGTHYGSGLLAKLRRGRSRSVLDTASRPCSSAKPCSGAAIKRATCGPRPEPGDEIRRVRPPAPRGGRAWKACGVSRGGIADRARFLTEERRFDLAFVDGNHRFDGVFLDLAYLGKLVRSGGIVFVDDYRLSAFRRAASFFVTNLGWTREEVSDADDVHQWAALRTSEKSDTRPFDYYVDF